MAKRSHHVWINKGSKISLFKEILQTIVIISISTVIGGILINDNLLAFAITCSAYILVFFYREYSLVTWTNNFLNKKKAIYPNKFRKYCSLLESSQEKLESIRSDFNKLENKFRELSLSMPDATVVIDKNTNIEWFNSEAGKLLNLSDKFDLGKPITNILRDPNFVDYIQKNKISETIHFSPETNPNIKFLVFLVPYARKNTLITFRDISAFDKIDKVRKDFVANVSHELKTPLTVLSGYMESLNNDKDIAIDKKILKEMISQTNRMDSIIKDLLVLVNLQSSSLSSNLYEDCDLSLICNELKQHVKPLLASKKQTLEIKNDKSIHIRTVYDEIFSAFHNLIINAIYYSKNDTKIEIDYGNVDKDKIFFSVRDYGIGIAPEHINRITERFYRVDQGRSRKEGGTGLGLSIVKSILRRHDGELFIDSKVGEGSIFKCVIPRLQERSASLRNKDTSDKDLLSKSSSNI